MENESDSNSNLQKFGFAAGFSLPSLIVFIMFVAVGCFLFLLDYSVQRVEYQTRNSSFQHLIQRIYRIIMIMGLNIWIHEILKSAGLLNQHVLWELAYNFVNQCTFIMAIAFSLEGCFIMTIAASNFKEWTRGNQITSSQILREIVYNKDHTYTWSWRWLPWNTCRNQVEFRIFRIIFSFLYHINGEYQEFDFSYYLRAIHESTLLSVINLNPAKWLCLIIGFGIITFVQGIFSNSGSMKAVLLFFTIVGWCLATVTVLVALIYRNKKINILKEFGLLNNNDYYLFALCEGHLHDLHKPFILNTSSLMSVILQMKHERTAASFQRYKCIAKTPSAIYSPKTLDGVISMLNVKMSTAASKIIPASVSMDSSDDGYGSKNAIPATSMVEREELENSITTTLHMSTSYEQSESVKASKQQCEYDVYHRRIRHDPTAAEAEDDIEWRVSSFQSKKQDTNSFTAKIMSAPSYIKGEFHGPRSNDSHDDANISQKLFRKLYRSATSIFEHENNVPSVKPLDFNNLDITEFIHNDDTETVSTKLRNFQLKRTLGCDDSNPTKQKIQPSYLHLLHSFVNIIITCNALYAGYWFTTIVFLVIELKSQSSVMFIMWIIISLLPVLVCLPTLSWVIKSSTLISAVTKLDIDNVIASIKHCRLADKTLEHMKHAVKYRLTKYGGRDNERQVLSILFNDMDGDGDMKVNVAEFSNMLLAIQMFLDMNDVCNLFAYIDTNQSGHITLQQLEEFLFLESQQLESQTQLLSKHEYFPFEHILEAFQNDQESLEAINRLIPKLAISCSNTTESSVSCKV